VTRRVAFPDTTGRHAKRAQRLRLGGSAKDGDTYVVPDLHVGRTGAGGLPETVRDDAPDGEREVILGRADA